MSDSAVIDTPANTTPTPSTTPAPAPSTAISEPWYKDWVQSDGTLNAKALERLPDHLKPIKATWERAKTIEDLGTTHINSQFLNGKKALAPLPADAPEQVKAERKALLDTINGVPKEPKEYGITKPPEMADHLWSQPMAEKFSTWAHKHSVAPGAVKELLDLNLGVLKSNIAAQAEGEKQFWAKQQQDFEATIKRENIPSEKAAALVEKGAIALGLDLTNEQTKIFLQGTDARLMAMRHAIAIGEDKTVQASGGGGGETRNYKELATSIRSNPADPLNGPFWNRENKYTRADHESAVAKYNEYLKLDAAKTPVVDRRRR